MMREIPILIESTVGSAGSNKPHPPQLAADEVIFVPGIFLIARAVSACLVTAYLSAQEFRAPA